MIFWLRTWHVTEQSLLEGVLKTVLLVHVHTCSHLKVVLLLHVHTCSHLKTVLLVLVHQADHASLSDGECAIARLGRPTECEMTTIHTEIDIDKLIANKLIEIDRRLRSYIIFIN